MIRRLKCTNFRSLEDTVFDLAPLTAIVGPNGTGKTSVLRALNLLLGTTWPSMRSVRIPQDFCCFDTKKGIEIEAHFDPPLVHVDARKVEHEVTALRFGCVPYKRSGRWGEIGDLHDSFEPLNSKGEVPTVALRWLKNRQPDFGPLRVSTGMREKLGVLFIDDRRSLGQHSPTSRGSVLSRLFVDPRKEFEADQLAKSAFQENYEKALGLIRTHRLREIEETIDDTAKHMLGFLGSKAIQGVKIGFGFADPANPFNSLRLEYQEGGLLIPAEELGLGIQSAMVVGIFEAFRRLGGRGATVVIEEPEMYLHPQAQRYFYRLLRDLAEQGECQVIYSTHSPVFADVAQFESIRLMRKEVGSMSSMAAVTKAHVPFLEKQRKGQKMEALDATRSEVLFARRALLVEGVGDKLAAQLVAQALGHDIDAEDLAIVSCESKSTLPFFIRICQALSIPYVVLHDEDIYPESDSADPEKTRKENTQAAAENQALRELIADNNQVFVMKPSLEQELGISRNAREKPRKIVEAIQKQELSALPVNLKAAVGKLFEELG